MPGTDGASTREQQQIDLITAALQQLDGSLRRPEHVAVPTQQPHRVRQADLDAAGRGARGRLGRPRDLAHPSRRVPGHHEGHTVRRPDVRGALQVSGAAGAADRLPELHECLVDVAEVAQHDAGGLVGDGGDFGVCSVGQEGPGSGEGLVRTRERESQQPVGIRGC